MDNKQYNYLIADIRTMCHCTEAQAKYIVTLCTRLNADTRKFVERLPRLTGKVKPSADEVIAEMEKVAVKNGVQTGACQCRRTTKTEPPDAVIKGFSDKKTESCSP